jgi:hypothetical protein
MDTMKFKQYTLVALDKFIHYFSGAKPQKETTTDDARKILKDYYKEKENDNR